MATPTYWPTTGWKDGWKGASVDDDGFGAAPPRVSADPGYSTAILPSSDPVHQLIQVWLAKNLADKPYTAETGEKTRMIAAQWRVDNAPSPLMAAMAKRRLTEPKFRSGVSAPASRAITVRKIRVIRNVRLWDGYQLFRDRVAGDLSGAVDAAPEIVWAAAVRSDTVEGFRTLPQLNPQIGEALLFHGTSKDAVLNIAKIGLDPGRTQARGKPGDKGYGWGMLGQGTYLTDSFAKTMTYAGCRVCGDFECFCRSVKTRKKVARSLLLVRVVLGRPKYFVPKLSLTNSKEAAAFRATPHDAKLADATSKPFHSVVSHGIGPGHRLDFGSGVNEMLARDASQMYPEFYVSYVLGPDDVAPPLADQVRAALRKWRSHSYNPSEGSTYVADKLDELVVRNNENLLLRSVRYFLGLDRPDADTAKYTHKLSDDGKLHTDLTGELQKWGTIPMVAL